MVDGSLFWFATGLKQEREDGLRPRRPLARLDRTNPGYVSGILYFPPDGKISLDKI
jgi:hypothetical protein